MEEGNEKKEGFERNERQEIFSRAVRAGKRTYFFDVKSTRKDDYYLTITESKKRFGRDGKTFYEKHKIFLYKEDFDKFLEGLSDAVDYIRVNHPEIPDHHNTDDDNGESGEDYTSVEFEDLGDHSANKKDESES